MSFLKNLLNLNPLLQNIPLTIHHRQNIISRFRRNRQLVKGLGAADILRIQIPINGSFRRAMGNFKNDIVYVFIEILRKKYGFIPLWINKSHQTFTCLEAFYCKRMHRIVFWMKSSVIIFYYGWQ